MSDGFSMICLALECSTSRRSVAVARDAVLLAEASHSAGRETPLFSMIVGVLARASVARHDVQSIAIGLGPGSYTGIRIAIAAAQGWELAHSVRLLGVDSVEATAHRARLLGLRGRIAVVADAHRGECYVAEYDLNPDSIVPLTPLRIATRPEVEVLRSAGARIAGPELEALGLQGDSVFPDAAALTDLAFGRTSFLPPEQLEPIYLRPTTFVKARPARTLPGTVIP